jgi:transcription elongation GreA/GreB family factor
LLNTKVGDKVKINVPAGILEYEIIEISWTTTPSTSTLKYK